MVSACPEDDALDHIKSWAVTNGIKNPQIIGWDFPHVSQEQINVFRMHGYTAACVLPEGFKADGCGLEVMTQSAGSYAAITIQNPFKAPFTLIPNAYKALMSFMQINGHRHGKDPETILCYEKVYEREGVEYMDVFIALDLTVTGERALRTFFAQMFTALPDLEFVTEDVHAVSNEVAVGQWRMSGTFSGGSFQGIEPTGRRLELRGIDVMRFEGQTLRHNDIYYDGLAFARQIGMLPTADSAGDRAMVAAFNAATRARQVVRGRFGRRPQGGVA